MPEPYVVVAGDYRENVDIVAHGLAVTGVNAVAFDLTDLTRNHALGKQVDLVIVDTVDVTTDLISLCHDLAERFHGPFLVMGYGRDERLQLKFYEAGIAEYVVKPIGMSLLAVKVSAWLRRRQIGQRYSGRQPGFNIHPARRLVTTPAGQDVRLSKLEYELFDLLHTHHGRVLPTHLLVDRIWGQFEAGDTRLKHLVLRLRRKVEPNPSTPTYIHTVGQEGYSLRTPYSPLAQM